MTKIEETIQKSYRIVIPKPIREIWSAKPGEKIIVQLKNSEMTVKPASIVERPTDKLWGIIKPKKHVKSPKRIARKAMEKAVREEYEIHRH